MPVNQCLVLPIFYRAEWGTLDAFCATAAEIGFKAIEVMPGVQDLPGIVAAVARHGLKVASMVGHASLGDGLNKTENHDRIVAELRQSIDIAADLGIPGMICFSGNRNPGQSDLEGMVTCARGLRRVVDYAEKKGVNLNMELLNSKVNHPGYQCDHTDWGVALCEMVNSPRVKLLFDIYHMQIMEGDVIRTIQANVRYIGHFHTAGNPGRHDLDDVQELNYTGICRAIAETGYSLYVGHEFTPKGDRMAALRHAYEVCAR
jgi:hydroxypyruvate isomerase